MKVTLKDGCEVRWPVRRSTGYAARAILLDERDLIDLSKLGKDDLYATIQQLSVRVRRLEPGDRHPTVPSPPLRPPTGAMAQRGNDRTKNPFDRWSMSGPEEGDSIDMTVLLCNDDSDQHELFELRGDSTVSERKVAGQRMAEELNMAKARLTFDPRFDYFHFLDAGMYAWRALDLATLGEGLEVTVCNFNQIPRIAIVMDHGDYSMKAIAAKAIAEQLNKFDATPAYPSRFTEANLEEKAIPEPSKQEWVDAKEAGETADDFTDWYVQQVRERVDQIRCGSLSAADELGF